MRDYSADCRLVQISFLFAQVSTAQVDSRRREHLLATFRTRIPLLSLGHCEEFSLSIYTSQQSHAAETAAKSAAAAAKAATTTAPAAAPGQKLKWADRGVLRPDGTVDNADWKCRGCGQPEITGFGGKGEDEVLLGCSCRHPTWHKSGRLDSGISRTLWVCSRFWKAQPPRDDPKP